MTNEEKAKIVYGCKADEDCNACFLKQSCHVSELVETAEWKEQQLNKLKCCSNCMHHKPVKMGVGAVLCRCNKDSELKDWAHCCIDWNNGELFKE